MFEYASFVTPTLRLCLAVLQNNLLSGVLPESIGNSRSLETLLINSNMISGSISNKLNTLKQLEVLGLRKQYPFLPRY